MTSSAASKLLLALRVSPGDAGGVYFFTDGQLQQHVIDGIDLTAESDGDDEESGTDPADDVRVSTPSAKNGARVPHAQ